MFARLLPAHIGETRDSVLLQNRTIRVFFTVIDSCAVTLGVIERQVYKKTVGNTRAKFLSGFTCCFEAHFAYLTKIVQSNAEELPI